MQPPSDEPLIPTSAELQAQTTHEVRVNGGIFVASRPCTPAERDAAQRMVTRRLVGLDAGPLLPPFISWKLDLFWCVCAAHPDPDHDLHRTTDEATTVTAVQLRLSAITAGWIIFDIMTDKQVVRCFLDPFLNDQLSDLVRFAQLLRDGAFPLLRCENRISLITRPVVGAPEGSSWLALDANWGTVQAIVDRSAWLEQWRALLTAIADTEHLAHTGLLSPDIPDTVVHDQATAEWQSLYLTGVPDNEEAEAVFTGAYIARRIRLTTRQRAYVAAQREMLRTMVIPATWPSLVGPDGRDEEKLQILLNTETGFSDLE